MKLYTRTGDAGQTGLFRGGRLSKDHDRVVAYGDVDELNAVLGLAVCACDDPAMADQLRTVQSDLFTIGAELASASDAALPRAIEREAVDRLEQWIDRASAETDPLASFIVPGGCELAARLHLARTVCRRAERSVVRVSRAVATDMHILMYLNRLSDWLFALARVANRRSGVADVVWSSD